MQLPALTIERAFGRLFSIEERVVGFQREYGDREDLMGLQLLLRALFFTVKETERLVIEESRRVLDHPETIETSDDDAFTPIIAELVQNLGETVTEPLRILERTHERRFDPLVQPLSRLARQIAPDVELIFQPGKHYDYGAGFWINEKLLRFAEQNSTHLKSVLERSFPRMVIIQYPALAHADTFWHAILAHELGHIALHTGGPPTPEEEIFQKAFEAFRDHVAADVERRMEKRRVPEGLFVQEKDRETTLLPQRALRWFIELACDDLALAFIGPAYFFALSELTAPSSAWEYEESHEETEPYNRYPALWWRLERSAKRARTQVSSFDTGHWPEVHRLIDEYEGRITQTRTAVPELEKKIVDAALGRLDPAVLAPDAVLDIEILRHEFEPVWEKIDKHIAPAEWVHGRTPDPDKLKVWDRESEWSRPMDWRAILNAGYVHHLVKAPPAPVAHLDEAERAARHRSASSHEILTAIELSELQRRVHGLRTELGGLYIPEPSPDEERAG